MHLVIGGAYQGKLGFVKNLYGFTDEQVFTCGQAEDIDFSRPCVRHIEEFVYGSLLRGEDAVKYFLENRALWEKSVLVCREVGGGVVPIDPMERAWREAVGSLCRYLAENADRVSRIFCGIEQRLK